MNPCSLVRFWPLLLLALLCCGCATTSQRTNELLTINYLGLADGELQSYYRQLNDQIATVERSQRDGTRVGIGLGSSPVQVGVSGQIGAPPIAGELRERRNLVRDEFDRRGLLP